MQSDNAQRHQSVKLMPWHSGILGKNKTFFSLVLTAGRKRKQKEVFVNASVCQRERERTEQGPWDVRVTAAEPVRSILEHDRPVRALQWCGQVGTDIKDQEVKQFLSPLCFLH